MEKLNYTVKERFLEYVKIDTQSDPYSQSYPSTEKQKDLTQKLKEELIAMGIAETKIDEFNYLIAKINSNVNNDVPSIFFCAHVDTAPDCSGTNVKPILRSNYQGEILKFPDDQKISLNPKDHPNLKTKIGHDLITASGLTLLGSDDKSGVAIIMDAAYQLINNDSIPHGDVYILFTPDEEVGKGVLHLDVKKLPAEFGYTLDGGDIGELNAENFSADGLVLNINGRSAHPGYAKDHMENAIKIAAEIVSALPKDKLCPEKAGIEDGFIHPTKIEGDLGKASVSFILRDFETNKLAEYGDLIKKTTEKILESYPNSTYEIIQKEQYRNMKDILEKHPHIFDLAVRACRKSGIEPVIKKIRGGTDGAVLTYKGLPCPNIFAGEQAIHSKLEWVSVQDMEKSVDTILNICELNTI